MESLDSVKVKLVDSYCFSCHHLFDPEAFKSHHHKNEFKEELETDVEEEDDDNLHYEDNKDDDDYIPGQNKNPNKRRRPKPKSHLSPHKRQYISIAKNIFTDTETSSTPININSTIRQKKNESEGKENETRRIINPDNNNIKCVDRTGKISVICTVCRYKFSSLKLFMEHLNIPFVLNDKCQYSSDPSVQPPATPPLSRETPAIKTYGKKKNKITLPTIKISTGTQTNLIIIPKRLPLSSENNNKQNNNNTTSGVDSSSNSNNNTTNLTTTSLPANSMRMTASNLYRNRLLLLKKRNKERPHNIREIDENNIAQKTSVLNLLQGKNFVKCDKCNTFVPGDGKQLTFFIEHQQKEHREEIAKGAANEIKLSDGTRVTIFPSAVLEKLRRDAKEITLPIREQQQEQEEVQICEQLENPNENINDNDESIPNNNSNDAESNNNNNNTTNDKSNNSNNNNSTTTTVPSSLHRKRLLRIGRVPKSDHNTMVKKKIAPEFGSYIKCDKCFKFIPGNSNRLVSFINHQKKKHRHDIGNGAANSFKLPDGTKVTIFHSSVLEKIKEEAKQLSLLRERQEKERQEKEKERRQQQQAQICLPLENPNENNNAGNNILLLHNYFAVPVSEKEADPQPVKKQKETIVKPRERKQKVGEIKQPEEGEATVESTPENAQENQQAAESTSENDQVEQQEGETTLLIKTKVKRVRVKKPKPEKVPKVPKPKKERKPRVPKEPKITTENEEEQQEQQQNDDQIYICEVCAKIFSRHDSLKNHIRGVHGEKKEKKHQCSQCGYRALTQSILKRHSYTHTGYKPFHCDSCSRGFASKEKLDEHHLIHETGDPKPFKCTQEGCTTEGFTTKLGLKVHTKYFHPKEGVDPKPIKCPWENCTAAFGRKVYFKTHYRGHTGEKPFVCGFEGCGAAYRDKPSLEQHKPKHDPSLRFICITCGKSFNTKYILALHETRCGSQISENGENGVVDGRRGKNRGKWSRLGPGEFKCPQEGCSKSYVSKHLLACHLSAHKRKKNPLKCLYCPKTFVFSGTRKVHQKLHFVNNEFKCPEPGCIHSYTLKVSLTLHQQRDHGKKSRRMLEKEEGRGGGGKKRKGNNNDSVQVSESEPESEEEQQQEQVEVEYVLAEDEMEEDQNDDDYEEEDESE